MTDPNTSAPTSTDPLRALLAQSSLGKYTDKLFAAGYDDLPFLQTRDEADLKRIAASVSMPIGHAERFVFAVNKHTAPSSPTPTPTLPPAQPAQPSKAIISPAADNTPESTGDNTDKTTPSQTSNAGPQKIGEAVAICIDRSYSMTTPINEMKAFGDNAEKTLARRTRMDAVKQIFYSFRDRTDTLDQQHGNHHLGLVQFDDRTDTMLNLTSNLALFESIVDDVSPRGSTAIYSVIMHGVQLLKPVFEAHPEADLRVLVLTDGESNAGITPQSALHAVNEIGATVDAIIVGDRPDSNLRRIVELTGGSCFNIKSLSEGFQLMESEAVVSLRARRGGTDKPPFVKREMPKDFGTVKLKQVTRGSAAQTVCRAKAPAMKVVTAKNASNVIKKMKNVAQNKRVIAELKNIGGSKCPEGVHIFPDGSAPCLRWRVLLEGPIGSPFEGGVFAVRVDIPNNYPFRAPTITFETPIYHCNVSDAGRVCLEILYAGWTPSLSILKCMEALRVMMKNPDTDNALRSWIAELTIAHRKSGGTDTRYVDSAKQLTLDKASQSIVEWKKQFGVSVDVGTKTATNKVGTSDSAVKSS